MELFNLQEDKEGDMSKDNNKMGAPEIMDDKMDFTGKGMGRRDAIKKISLMAMTAVLSPQLFFRNLTGHISDAFDRNGIQFIAVGNGANNIMSLLIERSGCYKGLGIETDSSVLNRPGTYPRILIGKQSCGGFGCAADPEFGKSAAVEDHERVISHLSNSRTNIIISCLGGGTGTGAGPMVAKWSIDLGADTFGIVTLPYKFEGEKRFNRALIGLGEFQRNVKNVLVYQNKSRCLKRKFRDILKENDNRIVSHCENLANSIRRRSAL
jgi:cell division GTPase FtsZ